MSTPDDQSEFERRTKALFDRSVEQLDARTRARLAQARAAALSEGDETVAKHRWRVWAPITGMAAAALASVAIVLDRRQSTSHEATPLDDLDLLTDDDLEMVQDLDFYAWLDEQPEFKG